MTEIASRPTGVEVLENVIIKGDLGQLQPNERVVYYNKVCESVGLNPFTQPFSYIKLNNKLTLYALKGATDQLRSLHGVSIEAPKVDYVDDLIIVSVIARDKTGRTDADTGAVTIGGLKGEAKANAIMKAITKAKRRVTLSMCGLGMLDETEVETIPEAKVWIEPLQPESPRERAQLAGRTETAAEPVEVTPEGIGPGRAREMLKALAKLGLTVEKQLALFDRVTKATRDVIGIEPSDLTEDEVKRVMGAAKREAEAAKPVWEKWETDQDARTYAAKSETFSSGQQLMGAWEEAKAQVGKENDGVLDDLYRVWFEFVNARVEQEKADAREEAAFHAEANQYPPDPKAA